MSTELLGFSVGREKGLLSPPLFSFTMRLIAVLLLLLSARRAESNIETIIMHTCQEGHLYVAENDLWDFLTNGTASSSLSSSSLAAAYHTLSNLALMLHADTTEAIELHIKGKESDPTVVPPLAKMHLDGGICGGLGDLYYVTAVTIKRLVDSRDDEDTSRTAKLEAHTTLITLLSDSGLPQAAELHLQEALTIDSNNGAILMRSVLMTPGVFESQGHVDQTRKLLESRIDELSNSTSLVLPTLDEFTLSPTFYYAYQGYNDRSLLVKLRKLYASAYEPISTVEISKKNAQEELSQDEKINIGFVSSYFRRHSVCKLFCNVISGLDREVFEVFLFASMQENEVDAYTHAVSVNSTFLRVGKTVVQNRKLVTSRNVDILVYLDIGMEPSTVVWAQARLAPIQVLLWGHPETSGMESIDYFLSSDTFHLASDSLINIEEAQRRFEEQLIRLPSTGANFHRPILHGWYKHIEDMFFAGNITCIQTNDVCIRDYYESSLINRPNLLVEYLNSSTESEGLRTLLQLKFVEDRKLILCPQHLPKFHPQFDSSIKALLTTFSNSMFVVLVNSKKRQWRNTLEKRWINTIGDEIMRERMLWLNSLNPQEYLTMLLMGDIMLDPYPFGGGVTILESLAVGTPVITIPAKQTVPTLADGMIFTMGHGSQAGLDLVKEVVRMSVEDIDSLLVESKNIIENKEAYREVVSRTAWRLYDDEEVAEQWGDFLERAHRMSIAK